MQGQLNTYTKYTHRHTTRQDKTDGKRYNNFRANG